MKPQLDLLTRLSSGTLVDSHGFTVSPRTRTEMASLTRAILLREQMAELETAKWFPILRKEYRNLRFELRLQCEHFLPDFLQTVAEKLAISEYQVKED